MRVVPRRLAAFSFPSAFVQNGFQPVPSHRAPHDVCLNFAFARGVLPANSPISSLLVSGRGYRVFSGHPNTFIDHVQHGPALVFFYKPACGPCKAIREKLISTVGEGFHMLRETATGKVEEANEEKGSTTTYKRDADADANTDSNENFRAMLETMNPEDQKTCMQLREAIYEKIDAAPDRLCFITVNTDENKRLTALHDVRSLPTFLGYHKGRVVGRVEGAKQEEVLELILRLLKIDDVNDPTTYTSDNEKQT